MADSVFDTRLQVAQFFAEVLVDLADLDESEEDLDELTVAMLDASNLLLESLNFEVVSVEDDVITATLRLPSLDEDLD